MRVVYLFFAVVLVTVIAVVSWRRRIARERDGAIADWKRRTKERHTPHPTLGRAGMLTRAELDRAHERAHQAKVRGERREASRTSGGRR